MKIFFAAAAPREIADSKTFVGSAHTQRLASDRTGTPVGVYRVDFEDGGRTNWHTHSGAQWLLIVEGRVRVQKAGEPPRDVAAGDAVVIEPGEKHWHGAVPGSRGTHLAVNVEVTTDWLEPVTDDQYSALS
jgi:quercetin dioxygenase-like cupin family protein